MDRNDLFSDIYDEYHAKILRYLERLVGELEAEEVTQVVFEKVSRNLNSFKGESKLSTWIYRIATNTALDKGDRSILQPFLAYQVRDLTIEYYISFQVFP